MKNFIIVIFIFVAFHAQAQKKSVGLILGSPTGLSYYQDYQKNRGFDVALDYRLGSSLQLHSTYLFQQPEQVLLFGQVMGWYYGGGVRLKTFENKSDENETKIGARASSGLLWEMPDRPFELFAEAALIMNIIPGTSVDIDAGIGARYKF